MRLSVIALAGLLALPLAAGAQTATPASPGPEKKASPDKKDRDKKDKDKKVFTNDDLKDAGKDGKGGAVTFLQEPERPADGGHSPSTSAASEEGRSSGSEEGRPAASEDTSTSGESGWRARAKEHRQAVQNALAEIQKLEAKLDAMRNPQQQPKPIEALQPDPQRRLTKDEERIQLDKDLEQARNAHTEAQKALDDFLEEARRNSVPPGWVEER